jgi:carbon-monoxide dehydrogenase small subunit
MTKELLGQHAHPTEEQIRHYLSGNLCRCAAYPDIIEAVKLAATLMEGAASTDHRPRRHPPSP